MIKVIINERCLRTGSMQCSSVTQRQFLLIFPFLQTNITSQMWPSGGRPRGGCFFLNTVYNTIYGFPFDSASDHSCCQHSATVVSLTTSVINRVRPSQPVDHTHRLLCCQRLRCDVKVEQYVDQLFMAVVVFLFHQLRGAVSRSLA